MEKNRLLRLADFLEQEVPEERFNMAMWVVPDWSYHDCKSATCAVGWACTMPQFQECGLCLNKEGNEELGWLHYPKFGAHEGWAAVDKFFGLQRNDADWLFDATSYDDPPTPKEVARRIRSFVADNGG